MFSVNTLTGLAGLDANCNRLTSHGGNRQYQWDDENRLISLLVTNSVSNSTFTDFYYDGLSRLRKRLEYIWLGSASGTNPPDEELVSGGFGPSLPSMDMNWVLTSTTVYIYDGNRVIQERDGSNNPVVSYTRGTDLSGSLEGAGGIGGLLARSSGYSGGNFSTHAYYHSDGGGNVTALEDASQNVVARYRYDPFGNLVSSSGSAANDNVYRFSSKVAHAASGLYYYLHRFYDPAAQRWVNRDPIGESGGENLYEFSLNRPSLLVDALGLSVDPPPPWFPVPPEVKACCDKDAVAAGKQTLVNLYLEAYDILSEASVYPAPYGKDGASCVNSANQILAMMYNSGQFPKCWTCRVEGRRGTLQVGQHAAIVCKSYSKNDSLPSQSLLFDWWGDVSKSRNNSGGPPDPFYNGYPNTSGPGTGSTQGPYYTSCGGGWFQYSPGMPAPPRPPDFSWLLPSGR